jgi:hypothetical protein
MARRKSLKLDACKVNVRKIRALGPNALMRVWSRTQHSKFGRTAAGSAFVGFVSNLATAKSIARSKPGAMHATPTERRHAIQIYARISRKLEREFIVLRAKKCGR